MLGDHESVSEFYEVEKTIEVVAQVKGLGNETVQIRALRNVRSGRYSTAAAILRRLAVEFADFEDPRAREGVSEPQVWVEYYLPWTDGVTADDVLNHALIWLRERVED